MAELSDLEILDALGVEADPKKEVKRSPREERIIAGFEDIQKFFEEHGRAPQHGEDKDIFERLYAVRLDKLREQQDCRELLVEMDHQGLLEGAQQVTSDIEELDDAALLAELGFSEPDKNDITNLQHVKSRAEKKAAEEIANRTPCEDFDSFKPLFLTVQDELKDGSRTSRRFKEDAEIKQGEFFILGGLTAYVAEVGEEFLAPNEQPDARLRVIYSNGTESNLLRRSLQRALYKDEAGRRISDPVAGPLFSGELEDGDIESGTIYVLRSGSDHPYIAAQRELVHKIGVTGGEVTKRISNAKNDPTYLLSDVEVVGTFELYNINRKKLEALLHKFFEPARLQIQLRDRFDKPYTPKEWYLVPSFVIDEVIKKIGDGTITDYVYDPDSATIVRK